MIARSRKRTRVTLLVLAMVATGGAGIGGWLYAGRWPKRFAAVEAGRLYRSGAVAPAQLERLNHELGIRRVVCLLNPNAPETNAEQQAAQRLGMEWHNVPLTGDGASTADERAQILKLMGSAGDPPTLVHCAAGTNRTGLAVGLYRLHRQHWPLDQVLAEMRLFDFEDLQKHENLRQALAAEAAMATSQPVAVGSKGS